jgi:signal peptidase I
MDHRDPSSPASEPPPLWPTASRSRPDGDASAPNPYAGSDEVTDAPSPSDDDRLGESRRPRRSDDTKDRSGGGAGAFFRELPILILVAFVLAFLLRTFVVQVFFIPSSSMEPTLQVDDRMVVEKITYRFREPRRGDIVVFEEGDTSLVGPTGGDRFLRGVGQFLGLVPASARDFVKRVIAVGGDEVRIEDGQVYVNDVLLDEPYVVFPDEDNYGPITVPDDSLFFLGDNRPNSSDSRRSLGFVAEDAVVGRAVVIIWPLAHWDRLTGVEHVLDAEEVDASGEVEDIDHVDGAIGAWPVRRTAAVG